MALTRRYETVEDCARLWIQSDFINADSDWFKTNECVGITYEGIMDYEDAYEEDEEGSFGYTHEPIWNTWFIPKETLDVDWIDDNQEEIAKLGFTIIRISHERFEEIALGIDGVGYDFYEAHWIPLYKLRGFTWHEG